MNDFAILDAPRAGANRELGRAIIDYLGCIEPAIDEIDAFCSMPIRLVHNDAMGFGLEVGPYDLGGSDIERLRAAINAYDQAVGA